MAQYPIIKGCNRADPSTWAVNPSKYLVQGGGLFAGDWPPPSPWATSTRNGRINWILNHFDQKADEGKGRWKNNQSRMMTAEMSFYWKFNFDANGIPRGCPNFDGANKNAEHFAARRGLGHNACGKQDFKDEFGIPMPDAVELYADNGTLWMHDFVNAYTKMYQNGWPNLIDGPNSFWTHRCCIKEGVFVRSDGTLEEITLEAPNNNPLECQKLCLADEQCKYFMYMPDGTCKLSNKAKAGKSLFDSVAEGMPAKFNKPGMYAGPKACSDEQIPFCQLFQ